MEEESEGMKKEWRHRRELWPPFPFPGAGAEIE